MKMQLMTIIKFMVKSVMLNEYQGRKKDGGVSVQQIYKQHEENERWDYYQEDLQAEGRSREGAKPGNLHT